MSRSARGAVTVLSAALLLSGAALAVPAEATTDFIGPPTAPVAGTPAPVAAPVAAAPVVPRAPAPAPGGASNAAWLRQGRPASKKLETRTPMSGFRIAAMLALVAGLGGVAYYARRRRRTVAVPTAAEKLKVLGSTRIGPKAFAVVAEVGGKRLLLGVTDQAVNTLAWLDADSGDADEQREVLRPSRPAPIRREPDETTQGPSGFLRVLRNAVGSGDARTVAADEIANKTRDEVTLSRRSKVEVTEELEGQVKGLARRRRRDPS